MNFISKKNIKINEKLVKKAILFGLPIVLIVAFAVLGVNAYVKSVGGENIISPEEAASIKDVDCILVLGCRTKPDGSPSDMLADRLRRGIELYEEGAAPKVLVSGDHGTTGYDEVNAMKKVTLDSGIPSSDIFMDHAGFSTYESLYRAKEIFGADKIIVVTQRYHLYRSLYIAQMLGIEAYGVDCDYRTYWGQMKREVREILARDKDFVKAIFKPEPTYLGENIPISGDGNVTND